MSNGKDRVLGRVLAVEETRHVSGAKTPPHIGTGPDGEIETSCVNDSTNSTCDITLPANDTSTVFEDSGTVAADTGTLSDCSTSRWDIASEDPGC